MAVPLICSVFWAFDWLERVNEGTKGPLSGGDRSSHGPLISKSCDLSKANQILRTETAGSTLGRAPSDPSWEGTPGPLMRGDPLPFILLYIDLRCREGPLSRGDPRTPHGRGLLPFILLYKDLRETPWGAPSLSQEGIHSLGVPSLSQEGIHSLGVPSLSQ